MEVDALGNLIARKGSGDKRVMLAAHMDQIGLVVTEADKKGFLRVHNVGYLRRPYALGCLVRFENGLRGVVAREVERDDPADMSLGKLFVDIGASSREEALERVPIGDMAVLEPQWGGAGQRLRGSRRPGRPGRLRHAHPNPERTGPVPLPGGGGVHHPGGGGAAGSQGRRLSGRPGPVSGPGRHPHGGYPQGRAACPLGWARALPSRSWTAA